MCLIEILRDDTVHAMLEKNAFYLIFSSKDFWNDFSMYNTNLVKL